MDRELERYHKNNAMLELSIQDYQLKKKSVQSTMKAWQDDAAKARLTIRRSPYPPSPCLVSSTTHFLPPLSFAAMVEESWQDFYL